VRVLVAGGTGFVGEALRDALGAAGHEVTVVSRDPERVEGPAVAWEDLAVAVPESDAIVNLAGESIAGGRWSPARKERIRDSRVSTTRRIVEAVASVAQRPQVLLNASAIGYYGPRGDETCDECTPAGTGFLADVCKAWEAEAAAAEHHGVRVVRLRLGVVLGRDGGALARMVPSFRAFLGGPLGDGKQWMSWIHRDDVCGLALCALTDERVRGPVNATAPGPVTNAEFARTLGDVLARPAVVRTPAFVLRLVFGELADMLLTGQRVLPRVADRLGYHWRYTHLAAALRASVRR
jgi:uncharacterized protein (TIGR01777 family)